MAKQMDQNDRYFSAAAELQKQWKLTVSLQGNYALLHSTYDPLSHQRQAFPIMSAPWKEHLQAVL